MSPFPRYEKYKDSGVEWLGEVPEHWEVEKGLRYFFETESRSHTGDEELLSVSHLTGVTPRSEKNITMFMAESYEGSKLCEIGDIAINTMWAWMAALGVSKYRGLVSPSYGTYRQKDSDKFNPTYLDHLIRTDVYRSHYTVNSTGITTSRLRLYPHSFLRLKFVCPPRHEQDRIVAFLDQKTSEIDALIAKKQRQIELLDEQKAILINRAVSQGRNPKAPLKDSGIEWIGEIPAHWEVVKLKYVIGIQAGYAFASSSYSRNPADIKLLRGANVNPGAINWEDNVYWPPHLLRGLAAFALEEGDLVMGMDRPWVSAGVRVARVTSKDLPCLLLQRVARIRATGLEADFLQRLLTGNGFSAYFEPILTGVSVPHISPDQIAGYTAAIPPRLEQREICKFIQEAETAACKVIQAERTQITSLQSLRSTLIAHAVTGKIQV